ncbi:DUF4199 domain-containing protein [Aggregatimonas sangjinii]|uniref:DUF4199 domain-containing protein n=1 Tax=Aggregatimonas sangjinii TaxID=2583587 RepID=A0A5B7SYN0_9FLAO|nr:DUF4199 domain-containing protein [Aggregatimonas sangjinii]QCX02031.1 DUF4199 domain-containing protein [Aggregatimonas sangjinii]
MKNFKIEFKWAVIFIMVQFIWMYIERATGLHDEHIAKHLIYTNLFGLVAIVVYVMALRDKKQNFFNGDMNWKQGLLSGIVLSVIIALFSPLTQYIISTYITPGYFENIIAFSIENGKMTLENARGYFNLKSYILQSAFGALTMGIVTSAVVAFFVKSKPKS